ncbi:hypothetical protein MFRU_010g01300 [Monilinia fructicola]|uniref:Uncharacterized protein n=1 Tax=Monilinia fructicola TaxID=38448 RepID=A0A5M9JDQ1_MONFR|nr:hypothetical protein EYC84_008209 [Monilinia fructicola]KAG4031004.1 hypothetical protein MFRU_010g01300 [Monilinia fructicola]
MSCYCANYYGSLNCQNMVSKFGDRCSLCLAQSPPQYEAFELSDAVIGQQWLENSRREQLRRDEDKSSRERVGRTVR